MNTKDSYRDNPLLKKVGVDHQYTKEQIEEYVKCSKDPVYFCKSYIKIVNVDEGLINFNMWGFQEEMINLFKDNRFVITKCPRQVGKTTTTVGYLLWATIFTDSQNVAVLANKGSLARDILAKYQLAYENLPQWLQQGVVTWNKGNVELENGSKVIAASTSSSAIRGGSFNIVFLDEFAFVPNNIANEFFNSVYPVISSGKSSKIIIVSTPNGMNLFYKLWMDSIEGRNNYKNFEIHWSMVPGRDAAWKEETIRNTSERQFAQEFETEFLGSVHTLVHPEKLKCLAYRTPEYFNSEGLRVYTRPEAGHKYVIVVDTSRGVGQDYHAFTVVDVTQIPYKVVATFRNNQLAPMLYPNAIYPVARQYNNAFVLVEINDIGQQVADILHDDMEYDNIIYVQMQGRKGQVVNGGFGRGGSAMKGVKTSTAVKRIGCAILKNLIEDSKLLVEDFSVVDELCTFVARGDSFEAEDNHNDDLVMTLVLFGWLTTQAYFKDITGSDIRKDLYEDQMKNLEEEMTPFGFVDDGSDPTGFTDGSGTAWNWGGD